MLNVLALAATAIGRVFDILVPVSIRNLMVDNVTGEVAVQIGCTVDQTLGERCKQHIDTVESIIKNDANCTQALSLTYVFWTSRDVTAKFITLTSSNAKYMWLNTWNGPHKSIPGLKTISIELWSDIYPHIGPEDIDYIGVTSHSPLQETTAEFAGINEAGVVSHEKRSKIVQEHDRNAKEGEQKPTKTPGSCRHDIFNDLQENIIITNSILNNLNPVVPTPEQIEAAAQKEGW
ncbi:hypothetical protein KCU65_g6518, partial [Aureobasidium melanogenum]